MAIFTFDRRIVDAGRYPWGLEGVLWAPESITTALWLDAADSSTITEVSGAVSQWADKSGNGWNAAQSTPSARPSFADNALIFTGTQFMSLASSSLLSASGTMNYSLALVFKRDGSSSNVHSNTTFVFSVGVSDDDAVSARLMQITWDDAAFYWAGRPGVNNHQTRNDNWNIHSGVARIGTGNHEYLLNGGNVQTVDLSGASPVSSNMIARIGTNTWSPTLPEFPMVGKISEIIIAKDAWDGTTLQKIEGYLAHKWGLESNLPSDHPYKTFAPRV